MARARNIKPGFYKNEDLAECSIWARFIFPGLWMLADRDGRLEDRPKRIKGELLPFDSADVEPLLRELVSKGFIQRYQIDGASYIQISKFKEHQSPHYSEKVSVIKPPTLQESGSIKEGSQPPDSLIPDSLNPESLSKLVGSAPNGASHARVVDESPLVIGLPLVDGSEFAVRQSLLAELEPLYPAVDVPQTLKEMKGWLIGHPERRKTKRGVRSFITKWLHREQSQHGS